MADNVMEVSDSPLTNILQIMFPPHTQKFNLWRFILSQGTLSEDDCDEEGSAISEVSDVESDFQTKTICEYFWYFFPVSTSRTTLWAAFDL